MELGSVTLKINNHHTLSINETFSESPMREEFIDNQIDD